MYLHDVCMIDTLWDPQPRAVIKYQYWVLLLAPAMCMDGVWMDGLMQSLIF